MAGILIQAMDNCRPEERGSSGISPGSQDFEIAGERGNQDDTGKNWADGGIISECKRATENNLAVVYNLQKTKDGKECSKSS